MDFESMSHASSTADSASLSWNEDVRVAAVEGNMRGLFRALSVSPVFDVHAERDVIWLTSESDCPIFNGALAASSPPNVTPSRTNAVLDELVNHGRPFYWWLTPTTTSSELTRTLSGRGLAQLEQTPGMYTRLDTNPHLHELVGARKSAAVTVDVATGATDVDQVVDVMLAGFGMPAEWKTALGAAIGAGPGDTPPGTVNALAQRHGRTVGVGTLVTIDGVAGLYNIAVLPEARNLGIGRAITLTLINLGLRQDCAVSILFASQAGYRTYRQLGYEQVCQLQQYAWTPPRDNRSSCLSTPARICQPGRDASCACMQRPLPPR